VGGGLAAFIGALLLFFTPAGGPEGIDLDRMAMIFIVMGVFGLTIGTMIRCAR
jgi:hypothetical protein